MIFNNHKRDKLLFKGMAEFDFVILGPYKIQGKSYIEHILDTDTLIDGEAISYLFEDTLDNNAFSLYLMYPKNESYIGAFLSFHFKKKIGLKYDNK